MTAKAALKKILRVMLFIFIFLIFCAAVWELRKILKENSLGDILLQLRLISFLKIFLSFLFAIGSYFALTFYDLLGLKYIHKQLPYRKAALTSFIAYSFGHSIGFSYFSGNTIRYHFYSFWGISALEVAKLGAFSIITFWTGFLFIGGIFLSFFTPEIKLPIIQNSLTLNILGIIFMALIISYLFLPKGIFKKFSIRGVSFSPPEKSLKFSQLLVSSIDWIFVSAALFILLPKEASISFPQFFGIYILAQLTALLSHVPGGLGVLESTLIVLLGPKIPPPQILGSLLLFRIIYYIIPLFCGLILFSTRELLQKKTALKKFIKTFRI